MDIKNQIEKSMQRELETAYKTIAALSNKLFNIPDETDSIRTKIKERIQMLTESKRNANLTLPPNIAITHNLVMDFKIEELKKLLIDY